ncbi:hypothetical protein ACP275_12G048700 [Erythranthe tilingii]
MNNNLMTAEAAAVMAAEAAAQLLEGINLVLSRWTALRMVIENEWGGRGSLQKSQQLGGDIFRLLTQSKEEVSIRHVDDMLYDFMDTLNTDIEDGSIEEISEKLMVMHEECLEGNFGSITSLREINTPKLSYVRQRGINDDEEDSEDDDDDILREASLSKMEVDSENNDTLREGNSSEMEVDARQKDSVTDDHTSMRGTPEAVDEWIVVCSKRRKSRKSRKNSSADI